MLTGPYLSRPISALTLSMYRPFFNNNILYLAHINAMNSVPRNCIHACKST